MQDQPGELLRGALPGDLDPDGELVESVWLAKGEERHKLSVWRHDCFPTPERKRDLIRQHLPKSVALGSILRSDLERTVIERPEGGDPVPVQVDGRQYRIRLDCDNVPEGHCNAIIESTCGQRLPAPRTVRNKARLMLLTATAKVFEITSGPTRPGRSES